MCFLKCRVSSSLRAKRHSQPSHEHLYGFSPANRTHTQTPSGGKPRCVRVYVCVCGVGRVAVGGGNYSTYIHTHTHTFKLDCFTDEIGFTRVLKPSTPPPLPSFQTSGRSVPMTKQCFGRTGFFPPSRPLPPFLSLFLLACPPLSTTPSRPPLSTTPSRPPSLPRA